MIAAFYQHLHALWPILEREKAFKPWLTQLPTALGKALDPEAIGELRRYQDALQKLGTLPALPKAIFTQRFVGHTQHAWSESQQAEIYAAAKMLMPWRKGPYQFGDLHIDTEWRSDFKWDRLLPHLPPLEKKRILDVGCGSGYHLWRMLGAGAQEVIGIDPTPLFLAQFLMVRRLMGEHPAWFLPLGLEDLPNTQEGAFDLVFSMGVLYHRRSPIEHLLELKDPLKKNGTLVLETLVMPEAFGPLLVPAERYAQMHNVWFIPSVSELTRWLARVGFSNIRCVDLNPTSSEEQRATEWSKGQSLADFLDPNDASKTIEGYPAPLRAILLAEK